MRLLAQMGFVALVIGTSVTAVATERVTLALVLTSALAWAFVPAIQLVTGLILVRTAGPGQRRHALERYFDTHRAWSLWILGVHAVFLVVPASRGLGLLVVPLCLVPAVLTMRALTGVCREVLGMAPAAARRAVALHQALTYVVVLVYAAWASAHVPRIIGLVF